MHLSRSTFFYSCCVVVLLLFSCTKSEQQDAGVVSDDLVQIVKKDTLRVGLVAGPVSYFYFRDEMMGFDLELAQNLATALNVKMKMVEAKSPAELTRMLSDREIDVAACNFQQTKALKKTFSFVLPLDDSYPVVVQRLNISTISSPLELKGKKVYVPRGTVFETRINHLNEETGNQFEVVSLEDTVTQEDLIEQVAKGKIDYTVADVKVARLYKTYYKKLDVRMAVGFPQRNGWLIRRDAPQLDSAITVWQQSADVELLIANLNQKYLRNALYFNQKHIRIPKGAISPYDHLFKKYAPEIQWEWQLLAALAFKESRFDSSQVSWAGASGIMQLMPRTAANFGLTRKNIFNPEKNIEAGVQYLKSLNLTFLKIKNKDERIKFILASYNSGPAHVLDARALTAKYGKNPDIWYGNVEYYLMKKSVPEYYNDPVVKYGRFRAGETVHFVEEILATYERYRRRGRS